MICDRYGVFKIRRNKNNYFATKLEQIGKDEYFCKYYIARKEYDGFTGLFVMIKKAYS